MSAEDLSESDLIDQIKTACTEASTKVSDALKKVTKAGHTEQLKVASPMYKSLMTVRSTCRQMKSVIAAAGSLAKKPKKPAMPLVPVFDKFGKEYPAGTKITYQVKKVALNSAEEIGKAEGATLGPVMKANIATIDDLVSIDPFLTQSALVEAYYSKIGKPVPLAKMPAGLSDAGVEAFNAVKAAVGNATDIQVTETVEVINSEDVATYGTMEGDILNNFETMPPSQLSGDALVEELINYHIFGQPEGFKNIDGKDAFQVLTPPNGKGVVIRLRTEHLSADMVDSTMSGKGIYTPLANKMAEVFGKAYGAVHQKVDKHGNPTTDPVVSAGNSGVYIQFDEETADGSSLLDAIKKASTQTLDDSVLRKKVKHTQLKVVASTPTIVAEKEVAVASSQAGINKHAALWSDSPFEAVKKMSKKGKGYTLPCDDDLIRDGMVQFYHNVVGGAPVGKLAKGGELNGHNFVVAFQPMGALKEQIRASAMLTPDKILTGHVPTTDDATASAVGIGDSSFEVDHSSVVTQCYGGGQKHHLRIYQIETSWGAIRIPVGLKDTSKINGAWDNIECVFSDPSVAETMSNEDLIEMLAKEFDTDIDLQELLTKPRTDEANRKLTVLKKIKFLRGGTIIQKEKKDNVDSKHGTYAASDSPDLILQGVLLDDNGQPVLTDDGEQIAILPEVTEGQAMTVEELDARIVEMAKEEEVAYKVPTSSMNYDDMEQEVKDAMEQMRLNPDAIKESIAEAFTNASYDQVDGSMTGTHLTIPDAHIQLAIGNVGSYSSIGTCNTNPAAMAQMFGSFGDQATTTSMGFMPSVVRQKVGYLARGASENADHVDEWSSGRTYQRLLTANTGDVGSSALYQDVSYLERCDGWFTSDQYGKANATNSGQKGRYALSQYKTAGNEVLTSQEASRSISYIRAANLSVANQTISILEEKHGAGNQTYVWELLKDHPAIFDQYADRLKKLGYVDQSAADLPEGGFNWAGFVGTSNAGSQRATLMSSILASIRYAESQAK